jgi:very-short-patch-repair endonuclease
MNNTRERIKVYSSKRRIELLEKSTSAEKAACSILARMGVAYKRQYPIWTGRKQYYADIYIPKFRLVLEIDGAYHYTSNQKRLDENRSSGIRRLGYHVCRLSNYEARKPDKIAAKLKRFKVITNKSIMEEKKMP